jgi:hypothetical protein
LIAVTATAARGAGFTPAKRAGVQGDVPLLNDDPYHGFGHDLVGETWDLKL